MTNQVIPAAAVEATVPEHLRGTDEATAVRAMLAALERMRPDGTRKAAR